MRGFLVGKMKKFLALPDVDIIGWHHASAPRDPSHMKRVQCPVSELRVVYSHIPNILILDVPHV